MKKNAFTLIELLAVIVILAIIALIATPIILGIISDAKDNANKRSAQNYLDAVEQAIVRENMKGIFRPTECNIEGGEVNCVGYEEPLKVEIDGEVPTSGRIVLDKGKVAPDTSLIYDNGYKTTMNEEGKLIPLKIYNDGDIVYFDVYEGVGCTKEIYENSWDETVSDYLNSKTGYNGINGTGNQNSCLKFYAFLDDGGSTLNLLLDHNTTANILWTLTTSNTEGPTALLPQLAIDTKDWNGTEKLSNYTMNQLMYPSKAFYTINYSEYKARIITAQEVAQITSASEVLGWNENDAEQTFFYYFDGKGGKDEIWQTQIANKDNMSKYYWLFDRTYLCKKEGCKKSDLSSPATYGFWTSSSYSSSSLDASNGAWFVRYNGCIKGSSKPDISSNGIRPVIEVYKSKLN